MHSQQIVGRCKHIGILLGAGMVNGELALVIGIFAVVSGSQTLV